MYLENVVPQTPFTHAIEKRHNRNSRNQFSETNKHTEEAKVQNDIYRDSVALCVLPRVGCRQQLLDDFQTTEKNCWCLIIGLTPNQWIRNEQSIERICGPILEKVTSNSNYVYIRLLNSQKVEELLESSNFNGVPVQIQRSKPVDVNREKCSQKAQQKFPEFSNNMGVAVENNQKKEETTEWLYKKLAQRLFSHLD